MTVNNHLAEPKPPGDWVDCEECVCGCKFKYFKSCITFQEAVTIVRVQNGGYEGGGGYRSRGPVLWAMRCAKLQAWYEVHMFCGGPF